MDENNTFLSIQSDSLLQLSWLITGEGSCRLLLSCHTQAKSEEVSTHFLTEVVNEHAFITFSLAFTSISAMDF